MHKNTIMIDSPGFTSETNVGKLKGNLRILKYFYQLSDLILFMSSADSLSNITSEVPFSLITSLSNNNCLTLLINRFHCWNYQYYTQQKENHILVKQ